jgi:flagellar hook assembly protein FlgD
MSSVLGPITGYVPSPSTLPTDTSKKDYKMEFLKLLLTQMQNQDPTNPVDSTEMIAQQAQFASLEQMQNLNTNFVTLMAMQNVSQATNLIGRTVTGKVNGVDTSGQVTGISFSEGKAILNVKISATQSVNMNLVDIAQVSL